MELCKAKQFIYCTENDLDDTEKIYSSKSLDTLLKVTDGDLIGVYAVVDTSNGEKLFDVEMSFYGEPIITRVFLHKQFFMNHHRDYEEVDLDINN